jgi:hypothetical protein
MASRRRAKRFHPIAREAFRASCATTEKHAPTSAAAMPLNIWFAVSVVFDELDQRSLGICDQL